jgi:hypothetical protein
MTDQQVESVPVGAGSDVYNDDFERNAVARALGFDSFKEIRKNQDQIKRLIDWAHAKGAKDYIDVQKSIQELANRVGSPHLGNNWAQHLAQYAYLDMEKMKIDGELKSFEKPDVSVPKANTTTV